LLDLAYLNSFFDHLHQRHLSMCNLTVTRFFRISDKSQ
jgi:hypothetical protein